MKQMVAEGRRGMWVPDARVQHLITPDRTTDDHISKFYYGLGNTRKAKDDRRGLLGHVANGGCQLLLAAIHETIHRGTKRQKHPARWIRSKAKASYCWGRSSISLSGFPDWMKPSKLNGRLSKSSQPRYQSPDELRRLLDIAVAKSDSQPNSTENGKPPFDLPVELPRSAA